MTIKPLRTACLVLASAMILEAYNVFGTKLAAESPLGRKHAG